MRIVQIVPELRPGRGVEAVAFHLDEEFRRRGIPTETFDLRAARAGSLLRFRDGLAGRLALDAGVIWFSTAGTWRARSRYRHRDRDTVVICHNDVVFGDVYVNHGNLVGSMRARGNFWWRMVRNPVHLFIWGRDNLRYARGPQRVVVNLTEEEDRLLRRTYPHFRGRSVVIGNGVDIEHYRPDPALRQQTRTALGLAPQDVAGVFVGHEFDRKGLALALEAVAELPTHVRLLVVGGTTESVASAHQICRSLGVADRVHLIGRVEDARPYFNAGDLLVFPSAYESFGLVVLEALACGLPVVATPVGCAPELVDSSNGRLVEATGPAVARGIRQLLETDLAALRTSARASAVAHSWSSIADRYLELFDTLLRDRNL